MFYHPDDEDGDNSVECSCTFAVVNDVSEDVLPTTDHEKHDKTPNANKTKSKTLHCSCRLYNGQPCYLWFPFGELENLRLHYASLEHQELDLVILSKISCGIHMNKTTQRQNKVQSDRKVTRTEYFHHGQQICRETFKYMHNISIDKLSALIRHYKENGITPRTHKNSKKLPYNTLSFETTKYVVDFIINYAECHAIMLPGRTPDFWNHDVKLLPTNCTKRSVYDIYVSVIKEAEIVKTVSYSSFRRIWSSLLPFIRTMPPATDLCWKCQKDASKLMRAKNRPEAKSQILIEIEEHLTAVTKERSYFRSICDESKRCLPEEVTSFITKQTGNRMEKGHYSFDFAQQLMYPSNPLQPGPIYFKTPRKCGLFGVHCEAIGQQMNYLIDEACSPGKGADCVVSLLHHFLEHYGLGEKNLYLHADNCSGQNKNSTMMQYLQWRVMTGLNDSITISFLLTGHTKFTPDRCFGLIKKKFRRTNVNSLNCIKDVVTASSTSNCAHVIGPDPTTAPVVFYRWTDFLSKSFKKVTNILKHHHFTFSESEVELKEYVDSPSHTQSLVKAPIAKHSFPAAQSLEGLSYKRQKYLYDEIRPFVDDPFKDIVCPPPEPQRDEMPMQEQESELSFNSACKFPSKKRQRHN